ncbi:MAG TPA: Crp/Fnr family transcriptional regulator [Cytophagales bacterium]|nr:Crp/Fnr family transcriptional regulator [Cytophagales bacterium]HAA18877.1 Crp/Fnr family transcriptional regulator [Cytophagales bacterium]HAP63264.1 Crp/Fnr family transcriptional regulator [Cytophagales bacterium]
MEQTSGIAQYVAEKLKVELGEGEALPFSVERRSFEKGTVLTDFGQRESSVYFILSGTIITSLQFREEERILDFHFAPSFCASLSSLLTQTPSDTRLTCYQACEVEIIHYAELKASYRTSLLANQLGRVATEGLFLERVKREKDLLTKTAEERYRSLLDKNPTLVQKIPVKELSKYLGIRPESLSRIRRGWNS